MNTSKIFKIICAVWIITAVVAMGFCVYAGLWKDTVYISTTIVLVGVMWNMSSSNIKLLYKIEEVEDDLKEAEEHIHYLTQHDSFKELKKANAEIRTWSSNCHYYLQRIGKLKVEIDRLKIINKNLIERLYKGKCYGNKNTYRRTDTQGDSRNNTSES